jgi:hypothetical protein
MPTDPGDTARSLRALDEALGEALVELPGGARPAATEVVDYRWLAIGMRLGLERPADAVRLLEMLGNPEVDPTARPGGDAQSSTPAGEAANERSEGSMSVPVRSSLLARAAALTWSERANMGPEAAFAWVATLTPGEILSLGRVVGDMLAAGSSADIGRGFGLTWDAGVRLPRQERNAMFREFTELEVTVGGVMTGRDLRAGAAAARPRGLGAVLDQLVTRARPEDSLAAAALEGSGEPGRRGLVALWNAWVAMLDRKLIRRRRSTCWSVLR